MSDITVTFKNETILTMDASGSKDLLTRGTYCEDDISISYVKPTGPSGTKQIAITENGTTTEDVAAYANAEITVNVQGGGGGSDYLADALNNTLQSYSSADVISIRQYGFASCSVRNVSVPNAEILNAYAFSGCNSLQGIVLPKVKQVNGGSYIFNSCIALAYADFGEDYATVGSVGIGVAFFQNCAALKTVILRTKTKVVPLTVATAFNGTPFASGGSGGTLYVPQALIASYEAAANWSTILGYANNSIAAIEGSQYENAYADGTPIT